MHTIKLLGQIIDLVMFTIVLVVASGLISLLSLILYLGKVCITAVQKFIGLIKWIITEDE